VAALLAPFAEVARPRIEAPNEALGEQQAAVARNKPPMRGEAHLVAPPHGQSEREDSIVGPLQAASCGSSITAAAVRRAVAAAVEPGLGLAFVPDVVRALARAVSVAEAIAALRDAAQGGIVELRPESGLGRLTTEERGLCVRGRDDILLSWARLSEERKS
jgi:hypothetical protein